MKDKNKFEIIGIISKEYPKDVIDTYKSLVSFRSDKYFDSQKVLKSNTIFLLNQNYKITYLKDVSISIEEIESDNQIFSNKKQFIQVNAIVGKNGSGKSTLSEILYLMLYNLAVLNGLIKDEDDEGNEIVIKEFKSFLNCILIIRKGNEFLAIDFEILDYYNYEHSKKVDSKGIRYFISNGNKIELSKVSTTKLKLSELFYMIALNYSMYGLNELKLGRWIRHIFHKNDMYQTPIVISPYREFGKIDVNKEDEQNTSRLLSNISSRKNESQVFTISNDYILDHYNFFYNLNNRKKTHLTSEIDELINSSHFSGSRMKYHPLMFIDRNEYNNLKLDSIKTNDIKKWSLREDRKLTIDELVQIFIFNSEEALKTIHKYFYNIKSKADIDLIAKNIGLSDNFELSNQLIIDLFSYFIVKLFRIGINYSAEFSGLLNKNRNGFNQGEVFEEALQKVLISNSHACFKLKRTYFFLNFSLGKSTLVYSATLEIPKAVPSFILNKFDRNPPEFLNYLNLKLYVERPTYDVDFFYELDQHIFDVNDISWRIPPSIFISNGIVKNITTKKTNDVINLSSGETQFIYTLQAILYHIINLNSNFELKNGKGKKYQNVVILLDEIELYHHPEYQRTFLSTLLKQIEELNLTNIENIQIILLTHSPFILSDIPSSNVLRLKDGKPVESEEKTFGANIHDLLANDFFLEKGFMGEFAKEQINSVIDSLKITKILNEAYKNGRKFRNDSTKLKYLQTTFKGFENLKELKIQSQEECKRVIQIIGEPMLYMSLMELYAETFQDNSNEFINEQIRKLENLKIK